MTRILNIIETQHCISLQPYHQMFVRSDSDPNRFYTILIVEPYDSSDKWICSCKGWHYRETCKHLAKVTPCYWSEEEGPEKQALDQKKHCICPRCGRPTIKVLNEHKRNSN